jgi:hypothetical protein
MVLVLKDKVEPLHLRVGRLHLEIFRQVARIDGCVEGGLLLENLESPGDNVDGVKYADTLHGEVETVRLSLLVHEIAAGHLHRLKLPLKLPLLYRILLQLLFADLLVRCEPVLVVLANVLWVRVGRVGLGALADGPVVMPPGVGGGGLNPPETALLEALPPAAEAAFAAGSWTTRAGGCGMVAGTKDTKVRFEVRSPEAETVKGCGDA